MNVKLNDNVVVIAGQDKGKTGRVVATSPKAGRVTVQGVNLQKRHQKARKANAVSQIIEREGAIDVSNVMVICDKCGKATRVKHAFVETDGKKKKVRVCKCGNVLDKAFKKQSKTAAKPQEEAPKKRTRKRTAKTEEASAQENKD
ncbi:MAG TPA: 50S ribosomal protein L24 [Candidatus Borkfalkia excrementavium]|uniref:Large ribosomal subunit protein uL24 n=1 Tax=Candidatus Borkfalkia excrementavium TaxID=2838505 RepID=A0A9D1Z8Z9_9FIRM|nr:50S ribosomal protein L24 [Candidatus Borkfalkia excrementavium]